MLKNSGWYDGRKIDITENMKFLEERGFEVFESAQKFMKEFGEMKINVAEVDGEGSIDLIKHTTCIKETVGVLNSLHFGLEGYVNERVIPIASLYDFEINLYISESGRIFKSIGWVGNSSWEAFDNIINEKGTVIWDKFNG